MVESIATVTVKREPELVVVSIPGVVSDSDLRLTPEQAYQLANRLYEVADQVKYGPAVRPASELKEKS